MSLESLEVRAALKPVQAELDRQKEKCARLKAERDAARAEAATVVERYRSALTFNRNIESVLEFFASPRGSRRPEGGEQFPNRECCEVALRTYRHALSLVTAREEPAKPSEPSILDPWHGGEDRRPRSTVRFCPKGCGHYLDEGWKFCPACGPVRLRTSHLLLGRRRSYPMPPELSETVNFPIQATAADMMNMERCLGCGHGVLGDDGHCPEGEALRKRLEMCDHM